MEMRRSGVRTVTVSVEDLSTPAALLSPGSETVAVLLLLGAAPTATETVSVRGAVDACEASSVGFVQVTFWPAAEQIQFVPVPETNVMPVGKGSVTVMLPVAVVLPTLVTVIVNAPFCATVKFPMCVFVIERSMTGVSTTVVRSEDDLFVPPGFVSPTSDRVAVLVMLEAVADATLTTSGKLTETPLAIVNPAVLVHVTVCGGPEMVTTQLQFALPLPAAASVSPAGNWSVTVIVPVVVALPKFFAAMV